MSTIYENIEKMTKKLPKEFEKEKIDSIISKTPIIYATPKKILSPIPSKKINLFLSFNLFIKQKGLHEKRHSSTSFSTLNTFLTMCSFEKDMQKSEKIMSITELRRNS